MLQLIVIAVYFVAMIFLGLRSRRNSRDANGFFVAGRKGSAPFITGSLLATIIGGSATVGMAGLGFSRGLTGIWWLLSGSIGLVVLGVFFARKVRDFGLYTLPGLVEKQYDGRVAVASSLLIVIAWMGVVAGQVVAAGKIMSVLGMGGTTQWMIIFAVVFILYTAIGGQSAVIKTDFWQAIIIFAGIFSGLGFVLWRLGGLDNLWAQLPAGYTSFPLSPATDGYQLAKYLLLVGLTYVVGPDMYSRIFSARDGRVAKTAVLWSALLLVPLALGIVFTGIGAKVLFPAIAAEQAFPTLMRELLPPVLDALVLAALLCAVMSSADTCLLSASTILTVDVIRKLRPSLRQEQVLLVSRCGIVVLGVLAVALALFLKGVISSLMFAYTVYTAGVIPAVIVGFYRRKLKVTSLGALAAVVGGGTVALVSQLQGIKYLDLGALGVSVVLLFGVSLLENLLRARKRGGVAPVILD